MLIREIIWVALGAIRANALRSFLTTLGIIIGVSAVIAMVALGEGAQRNVEEQISRMGTNVLTIRADRRRFGGVSTADTEDLKVEDAEALRSESGGLLTISPELMAVLGFGVPEELGTPAPLLISKTIQIRGQPCEVLGVLEEKGDAGFNRPDEEVYVPTSTAQYRVFGGRARLSSIFAQVPSPDDMDGAYGEIDRVLRREHRIRGNFLTHRLSGDEALRLSPRLRARCDRRLELSRYADPAERANDSLGIIDREIDRSDISRRNTTRTVTTQSVHNLRARHGAATPESRRRR